MQLNIKNPETYKLAATLSRLTGESLTQAVTKAIAQRLENVQNRKKKSRKGLAERLTALSEECRKLPLQDDRDHADMLYDEDGLPK